MDAAGWALAAPIAGAVGRRDGAWGDAGADGAVAACRGGTVATAGGAATAIPAGLPAQAPAAATPHPATTVRELTAVRPDAGPGENTLGAR